MNSEKSLENVVAQTSLPRQEAIISPEVIRELKLKEAKEQLERLDLLLANITAEEVGRMGPEAHSIQEFLTKMQAASLSMGNIESKPN